MIPLTNHTHQPEDEIALNLGDETIPPIEQDVVIPPQEPVAPEVLEEIEAKRRALVEQYGGRWVAITAPNSVVLDHEDKDELVALCKDEYGDNFLEHVAIERIYAPGEGLIGFKS